MENVKLAINYGLNKVRFLSAVPVDSRIRCVPNSPTPPPRGRRRPDCCPHHWIDGVDKPAAVAEMIVRVVF